jgi:hypothetical protein
MGNLASHNLTINKGGAILPFFRKREDKTPVKSLKPAQKTQNPIITGDRKRKFFYCFVCGGRQFLRTREKPKILFPAQCIDLRLTYIYLILSWLPYALIVHAYAAARGRPPRLAEGFSISFCLALFSKLFSNLLYFKFEFFKFKLF